MKKIIFSSLFLISIMFFAVQNTEAASVLEPQWAEFCPPLYENVVFKPARANSKRDMENNFWGLRKAKFDKSIAECKVISKNANELGACFSRVANLERNKTNQRNEARMEKNLETEQQIRDGGYWWY